MGWPTFSGFIDGGECVIFFNRPKLLLEGRRRVGWSGKLVWIQIFFAREFLDESPVG